MIKVSVIVPVYNTSKYLNRCLDSLVNQTLKDIEIIIINDKSTDDSIDIIKEYENKYKNIRVIHNKTNKGIGYNRNLGIEKSSGKYISFIDSDDWVSQDMYEKMYNKAIKDKDDLVICNYFKMLEENSSVRKLDCDYYISERKDTILEESPSLINEVNLAPWNKIYKKELLEDIRFPEKLKYEDAIVTIKALARAKKIGFINEKLNYYLVRSKSETTVMNEKVFDIFKILDMIIEELKEKKYYKVVEKRLEFLVITTIFRYTLQQRYQKDKILRKKFIDEAFDYLNNNFPNWKDNEFYRNRNFLKRIIETNKLLTNVYCNL